jgi:hypothetical protein
VINGNHTGGLWLACSAPDKLAEWPLRSMDHQNDTSGKAPADPLHTDLGMLGVSDHIIVSVLRLRVAFKRPSYLKRSLPARQRYQVVTRRHDACGRYEAHH